jgi:hypothetical protein
MSSAQILLAKHGYLTCQSIDHDESGDQELTQKKTIFVQQASQ